MRIVFDCQLVEKLAPKIARQIDFGSDIPLVEGVILSADQVVSEVARKSKIGLYALGAIVAAILIMVLIIVVAYEPEDLVEVGPLYLVILVGLGVGGSALYHRGNAKVRENAEQRAIHLPPPGTRVRLDAAGLTLGDTAKSWSGMAVDTVEIFTQYNQEGDNGYYVEAVTLCWEDQSVTLNRTTISNGQAIVGKALRALGVNLG